MKLRFALWGLVLLLLVVGFPSGAKAIDGPCYANAGYGYPAWGYLPRGTYMAIRSTLPYYALHPPVYYSHPVKRAYGVSPFAAGLYGYSPEIYSARRPSRVQPPVQATRPLIIDNPFFNDAAS